MEQQYTFWLIAGTQDLYGAEVVRQVNDHARIIAKALDEDPSVPGRVVCMPAVRNAGEITDVMTKASADESCVGVITWDAHLFAVENVDRGADEAYEALAASAHPV